MRNIIVPIDFSEESINGLRMAIIFANRFESRIQMVYVQKMPSDMGRVAFDEEKTKAIETFDLLVKEFSAKLHNPSKLDYIVKKGKVFKEVINQAQAFDDSIIVCSTHGASGFEEFFIGSNAFKIISASDIPVVTIRHGSIAREIATIVLPIDSTNDTRQKVPFTATIAKAFNAEVHVLGVVLSDIDKIESKVTAYIKQVCEYLKDHDVRFKQSVVKGNSITSLTINYAIDVKADLITIMTEQNDSISDFVLGTQAQQMLNKSPIPVFSVTPKDIFITDSFRTSGS